MRAVLLVIAFDRGFIGVTAVNRDRFGEPIAADRLFQKPERGRCIPVLGEQKVNGLAVFVDSALQRAPLALHFNIRFVHAPTDPDSPLAAMKCGLKLGAIFADPAVDGGVIDLYPTFKQEFFDMTRA